MTIFQKIGGQFAQLSAAAEIEARADATALFGNDSGYEIVLSPSDAAAIREEWGRNSAQNFPPSDAEGSREI